MKTRHFLILALSLISFNLAVAATRTIKMSVEKLADGTHWMPKEVTVTKGEEVNFEVTNNLEGMKFHGFQIKGLVEDGSIDYKHTKGFAVKINLEPGTYEIKCQFHPAHQPAKLIVKPESKATEKKS